MKFGEIREFEGKVTVRGKDGIFRDKDGTEYGVAEPSWSVDNDTRLGVGIFSLPESDPLTGASIAHDFEYSSPAYQKTHERLEADALFEQQALELAGNSTLERVKAYVMSGIVRLFGGWFWEDDKTR